MGTRTGDVWERGNREVYVMNADGSRMAFVSDRDGNDEIYVVNADGSGLTNLTNSPDWDGSPAWSPVP